MLFVRRDDTDTDDLAKKKYFEFTHELESSVKGNNEFMNATIDTKRIKL